MSFVLGQKNPTGKIRVKELRKATDIILTLYEQGDRLGSVHKAGCKDIKKDRMKHWGVPYGRFADTKTAIEYMIEEEMCEMGHGELEQVRVFPCAKDESYKANINQEPVYLATHLNE